MLDLTAAFATFPVLTTERLVLRELLPEDVDAMYTIMADPLVMRYFGSAPMAARDEAVRRIAGTRQDFAEQSGIRWAITRDGQYLGSCGFWRIVKAHLRAEVGYELAPSCWGQGLMPEAVGAILHFGFTAMGLHSVEAQIDPANDGSRRVLEKLGFVQEGYFRESFFDPAVGHFTDTAVFSLLVTG